jgi:hypothetical protein
MGCSACKQHEAVSPSKAAYVTLANMYSQLNFCKYPESLSEAGATRIVADMVFGKHAPKTSPLVISQPG